MDTPPVQYVKTSDGYDIAYSVGGQGVPLVRVSSLFGHFSLQWSRGILADDFRVLSEHFQLVLFDARGQGSSTRGLPESTCIDDYVKDLEVLVNRVAAQRFVLLAMSAMGKVAVSYAAKHPDRVIALVLHGYVDLYRGTRTGLFDMAKSDWPVTLQTAARVGWVWADPATVVGMLRESILQEDFLRQYLALSAEPDDEVLRSLEVPTLVMAAREASRPIGGEQEAKRIAAQIPNARLVLFEDPFGGFRSTDGGPPPAIAALQHLLEDKPWSQPESGPLKLPSILSAREIEVLRLLAAGRSNAQIAEELVISQNTVIRHVSNIFAKIGAANRVEAATYAKDNGLA